MGHSKRINDAATERRMQEGEALLKEESITKKTKPMKTVNIQGKAYVEVNERIKYLRENFKGYAIITNIEAIDESSVLMKAVIKNEQGQEVSTGHAHEVKGDGFINKTSHIENCETSAVGRALGNLGIGIDVSIASAEEVSNAISNQNKQPKPKRATKEQRAKIVGYMRKVELDLKDRESIDNGIAKFTEAQADKCIKFLESKMK